jgi:ectoine hydroxylase-related dioxygenase (phytanoyl-CoA dioxygenase family)
VVPFCSNLVYWVAVSTASLSASQIEAFGRDGFVVVKGLIDAGQVRELLADYDRVLRGEIEVPAFGDRRVEGSMVQLANPSQHMAHWRDHAYFRRALAAARLLIGPDAAYQYDQLIMKPAHYPAETDWHQDAGYWQDRNGSDRAVTCWLALTPAWEENGGMQFIPGSHRGPIQEHFSIAERSEINGALATTTDNRKAVAVTLEPGDATFHHCRTLHYAGGNATGTPRYGVITHFWSAAGS